MPGMNSSIGACKQQNKQNKNKQKQQSQTKTKHHHKMMMYQQNVLTTHHCFRRAILRKKCPLLDEIHVQESTKYPHKNGWNKKGLIISEKI
jgi:hypothetical protein